ncbi:MAG: carbohydrate ABC transporter permease, partial [Spirulinaceae cyanobacterium]
MLTPLLLKTMLPRLRFAVLCLGAVGLLFPLMLMVTTSLQTPSGQWTGQYYSQAWQQGELGLALLNSLGVALGVTLLQVGTAAIAGYALARFSFRGRRLLLGAIVVTLVIPLQLLVIPIFLVLKGAGLINTYGALILPTAASGYSIFWLRQFFLGLPPELEAAAALD